MANMFANAPVINKSAKAGDKDIHIITDPATEKALADYTEAKKAVAIAEAKLKKAESILKPYASEKFIDTYQKIGSRPESFIISDKSGNSLMYIPQDRYTKVTDETKIYLTETYGCELLSEETTFTLDSEMINKHGEAISNAIAESSLSEEVKNAFASGITRTISISIAKGTIDNLADLAKKFKTTIAVLFAEILPVQQLKSVTNPK